MEGIRTVRLCDSQSPAITRFVNSPNKQDGPVFECLLPEYHDGYHRYEAYEISPVFVFRIEWPRD